MKINEFTKSQQLLIFIDSIEKARGLFSLSEYGDSAINYGIATSKKNLSSILSNLKKEQWIMNDANGYWELTTLGMHYVDKLLLKLNNHSWFSIRPKENKKIEQPNSFADTAQKYADIAKDIASKILNQYGVNTNIDEIAKLQEENDKLKYDLHCAKEAYDYLEDEHDSLANELNEAKTTIENLRKTLQNVYAQLDKKTKECEKFQSGFDKLKDACQSLTVWIGDMKHGQGI